MNLRGAAHYFKLSADQGNAAGQFSYGLCLLNGDGVPIDLCVAAHYFKLAAQQSSVAPLFADAFSAVAASRVPMDLMGGNGISVAPALTASTIAVAESASGDSNTSDISENARSLIQEAPAAARCSDLPSDLCRIGCDCCGWCFHDGRAVPIDFTVAAEFFQRAANCGDSNGANSIGVCFECGKGVEADIDRAVFYYERAAADCHPDGLYNFARCLEFGKGVPCDAVRAAKCYRLAADLGNAAAENSFGICLERGIGVHFNIDLAAEYYQRSAVHGHPGGANNLGFCLEHGRGVCADIELAAEYYKFAADHGSAEAGPNYHRCLRLLRRWEAPDRYSDASFHPPSTEELPDVQFVDPPDRDSAELIASIRRLKNSTNERRPARLPAATLLCGSNLAHFSENTKQRIVVKSSRNPHETESIRREGAIHSTLTHPLVLGLREFDSRVARMVTEFVGNGTLADHLATQTGALAKANRIARIVVGIVHAMRHIHERGVIHRDLKPENVLLDWKANVRIAGFKYGVSRDNDKAAWPMELPIDCHYLAPECFSGEYGQGSDVFAFALILFELLVGQPAISKELQGMAIMRLLVADEFRPDIPESVLPRVQELIRDCWKEDPDDRPSFEEVFDRLEAMDFKVIAGVNSTKLRRFVEDINPREEAAN
jgi:TPR repeat protein